MGNETAPQYKERQPIKVGDTEWTPRPEMGVYVWKGGEVPGPSRVTGEKQAEPRKYGELRKQID